MFKSSTGLSISKATKYLYSKGIYYYSLNFAYPWNSCYFAFHWGF